MDEFRHFEEEQMMRDFDRMDLGMHMDPRMRGAGPMPYGRPPMDPRAFDMMQAKNRGPRNLPPELLEQMGPQHHAPLNMDNKAWDNEYEAAIRGPEASSAPPLDRSEAEMFDRFEREFAPPGARAGLHGPARLQGPPSQLQHGAPDWASEFDQDQQESKFADWERIYRTSSYFSLLQPLFCTHRHHNSPNVLFFTEPMLCTARGQSRSLLWA